jgi:hypothetical protein
MDSPASSPDEIVKAGREQFDVQRIWLRNVLPPSREVCPVCRGPRDIGFDLCAACGETRRRSAGRLANAVVPISYSTDGPDDQHYHNLKIYKYPMAPNQRAQVRLAILYALFYEAHRICLERVAGGSFTHRATVPSTRQRPGRHPLLTIADFVHPDLPGVSATVNDAYGNARVFEHDRFAIPAFRQPSPRVLLLEDLWVTGARAQSMAHALKIAGAGSVVVVTLGRQLKLGFPPAARLFGQARTAAFDLTKCALDGLRGLG